MPIPIRPATAADAGWMTELREDGWGGPVMVAAGRVFDCLALPALIAGDQDGLAVYAAAGKRAELVLLEARRPGRGIPPQPDGAH